MNPMLCQPITQACMIELCHDDEWVMSPKIDGRRVCVEMKDGEVTVWAKSGEKTKFPHRVIHAALTRSISKGHFILDGELVRSSDQYQIFFFDLVKAGDVITPGTPFRDRLIGLETMSEKAWNQARIISALAYARTTEDKLKMMQRVYSENGEGVVLRRLSSPYEEGLRSDAALKYKLRRTADCEVIEKGRGGKDNLALAVYRDGERIEVGEVTALAGNGKFAQVGMVVEVIYDGLSKGGKLIRPTKPIIRTDKSPTDCLFSQLVPLTSVVT